jgi:exodeoxyribonuclease VII small subunit
MAKKAQVSFEDALARLDEIVRLLEGGKLTLDETVSLYEEGMKLSDFCKGKLTIARNKVMILTQENNNMKEVEFNDADE